MRARSLPAAAPLPRSVEQPRGELAFFVPQGSLIAAVAGSVMVGAWAYAAQSDASVWVGLGAAASAFIVFHALIASRTVPWIPGLLGGIAALQWILAPLAAYSAAEIDPRFAMVLPESAYLSYAVPATLALFIGACSALVGWRATTRPAAAFPSRLSPRFVRTCQVMVVVGVAVKLFLLGLLPPGLRYAGLLVGQLSFVGAFALTLARHGRWYFWVVTALAVEAMHAAATGLFHDVLLWSAYLVIILAYRYRLSALTLVIMSALGALVVIALNGVKPQYRAAIAERAISVDEQAATLASGVLGVVTRPDALLDPSLVAANISRLNQGWIIARVMKWVPASEPFARGETIASAVRAALLPRFLAPDKYQAGGFDTFQRFTGYVLLGSTSMNLSAAGEMYANFGTAGGLIGVFVYGLIIGLLYRMFLRWSAESMLWWAWAPYVMFWTVQAESGIGEATNQVVKSLVVMVTVITVVSGWSSLRRWRITRIASRRAGR